MAFTPRTPQTNQRVGRPSFDSPLGSMMGGGFGSGRKQAMALEYFSNPGFVYNYHLNNQRQMFNNQRDRVQNIMRQMEAGDQRARLQIDREQAMNQGQNAIANLLQEMTGNRQRMASTRHDIERTGLLDELRLRQQLLDTARQGAQLNQSAVQTRARQLLGR